MGRINSTYSGGYYQSPDFDVYQVSHAQDAKKSTTAIKRKVTYMLELTLRCSQCDCFIGRMTKLNAVVTATEDKYISVRIYRLEFKCPYCKAPISLKTDPKSRGYIVENGASSIETPWSDRMHHISQSKDVNDIEGPESPESKNEKLDQLRMIQDETDSLYALQSDTERQLARIEKMQEFVMDGRSSHTLALSKHGNGSINNANIDLAKIDEFYHQINRLKKRMTFNHREFPQHFKKMSK